jgi:septum formation protein
MAKQVASTFGSEKYLSDPMHTVKSFFEKEPLILASQSPRRKQLLEEMDIPVETRVSHTDESYDPLLSPKAIVRHIAEAKAKAVAANYPDRWILAADTIVVIDHQLLGKPRDAAEALSFLQLLSGQEHTVMTAFCLYHDQQFYTLDVATQVHFRPLLQQEMMYYIDKYKPFDKAGAYGIQEWIGWVGITHVEGSYTNVVGLPTAQVAQMLAREIGKLDPEFKTQ